MRLLALSLVLATTTAWAEPRTLRLWHSYRGAEEQALDESIQAFQQANPEIRVDSLANPYEGYASKLATAIPNDNGPDVFIFAHERVGGWAKEGIVVGLDERVPAEVFDT